MDWLHTELWVRNDINVNIDESEYPDEEVNPHSFDHDLITQCNELTLLIAGR